MKLEYIVKENRYFNVKEVLKEHFKLSDRLITKLKKFEHIYLNGEITYINHILKKNDSIVIDLNFDEKSENIISKNIKLNILFEDESLLIVNKPSNMPVHPSISHFEDSLSNGVQFYFNKINLRTKIRPVNRLDKDTSGIVIFAKNEYIQECLIKQMKSNTFKKEYYAILEGHLDNSFQIINAPIGRKTDSIIEREINYNGDNAITYLELIKNFEFKQNKLSFVKFELKTGRTHQLRVHSKFIGHPILGDTLYGNSSNLINRQALHAYKINFIHPIKKEYIEIKAPLPKDFDNIVNIIKEEIDYSI